MIRAILTPTDEHGPINYNGEIVNPGREFAAPLDKAKKLVNAGKATWVAESRRTKAGASENENTEIEGAEDANSDRSEQNVQVYFEMRQDETGGGADDV